MLGSSRSRLCQHENNHSSPSVLGMCTWLQHARNTFSTGAVCQRTLCRDLGRGSMKAADQAEALKISAMRMGHNALLSWQHQQPCKGNVVLVDRVFCRRPKVLIDLVPGPQAQQSILMIQDLVGLAGLDRGYLAGRGQIPARLDGTCQAMKAQDSRPSGVWSDMELQCSVLKMLAVRYGR